MRTDAQLALASTLAVAGAVVHDVAEFGRPSQENAVPLTIILGVLVVGWWRIVGARRLLAVALVVVTAVMPILGGVLSVLPLDLWPFDPEQSVRHYVMHAIAVASAVPLLLIAILASRKT